MKWDITCKHTFIILVFRYIFIEAVVSIVVVATAVIYVLGAADISSPSTDGLETLSVLQLRPSYLNIFYNKQINT